MQDDVVRAYPKNYAWSMSSNAFETVDIANIASCATPGSLTTRHLYPQLVVSKEGGRGIASGHN